MALTKNDLNQIGTIVEKKIDVIVEDKINASEKRLTKKIEDEVSKSEQRLTKKIEDEVGELAAMTKRQFDAQDKRFDAIENHLSRHDKKLDQIGRSVANLEFIATEMVRRDEFLEVKNRLAKIEAKLGLVK